MYKRQTKGLQLIEPNLDMMNSFIQDLLLYSSVPGTCLCIFAGGRYTRFVGILITARIQTIQTWSESLSESVAWTHWSHSCTSVGSLFWIFVSYCFPLLSFVPLVGRPEGILASSIIFLFYQRIGESTVPVQKEYIRFTNASVSPIFFGSLCISGTDLRVGWLGCSLSLIHI